VRIGAAIIAVAILAAGLLGGYGGEPSPEPTVQAFLLAWEQQRYGAAAALTTGQPAVVTTALRTSYQQLAAAALYLSMGRITQHGNTADASFFASVDLGRGGAPWTYDGRFTLRRTAATWKVDWSPSVINPGLRPGLRLAVLTSMPRREPVEDVHGRSLLRNSPAYVLGVWPDKLADPAATALAFGKALDLDPAQVLGQIQGAPPASFLELLTLSPTSYTSLGSKLGRVQGLAVFPVRRQLFDAQASEVVGSVSTENSAALRAEGASYQPGATIGLSGLEKVYQRMLVGTPTTEVVTEDAAGHQVAVLDQWKGQPGTPVRTTIDARVQAAADTALASGSGAGEVVAVQASTGAVLAVSDHGVRGQIVPPGGVLDGHMSPGNAFTIVSTAALLGAGFSVQSTIPCTSKLSVGGQTFTNDPTGLGTGTQPLFSADFANGCATAFVGLSRLLNSSRLTSAATGFGLGANWQLPLPAFAGSVPAPSTDAQLAADTLGSGNVQVSPLDMALVAAEVDSGTWHPPSLVTYPPDPGLEPKAPFSANTLDVLRQLMRGTVQSGAATSADLPGAPVYGQVGVAPVSNGRASAWVSWFVGFRGGVAFTAIEFGNSPQVSAVALGARFLQAMAAS
jgi:cell division protein FtsI/penicillin-binding protein 2